MKKYFALMVAFAAIVSCQKEQKGAAPEDGSALTPMTFRAVGELTKTTLDGQSVVWSTADKINVFSGSGFGTNTQFTVASTELSGHKATFDGLAAVSPEYYALFPYQAGASITAGGIITAELPSAQAAVAGSFGPEANLSVAYLAGEEELQFKNVGALLSVTVNDATVTGLKLQALGGGSLSGTATIDYNAGAPVVSVTDGHDSVETAVSGTGTYYFVVFPGTYTGGFKITLSKPGYTASVQHTGDLTVSRNDNVHLLTVDSVPAEAWKVVFTPGDKVYIKGIANANENGQEVSYIPAGYYAPRAGGSAPSSPAPGDESALAGITYNYEVWAKIAGDDQVYFETENGARFAINVAADHVAPIGSDEVGPKLSVSDSPYRIRINLPSGDAQVVRVSIVNWGIIYGTQNVNVNLDYDKAGAWKIDNYVFKHDYQSWDENLSRYRFSIWFDWQGGQGGHNINVWQRYGTCTLYNNLNTRPSTEDPAENYYYVQPFSGDGWDTIFYMPEWLFTGWANETKKGTINLYMNNTYGHFTHGYSNVVDKN